MNLTEARKFVVAQGVPSLLLRKPPYTDISMKAEEYFKQFHDMLKYGGSIFIASNNFVTGSQIAVCFLVKAFELDLLGSRYATLEDLCQMFADSWEESELYGETVKAPFAVLDKIIVSQLDAFRKKTLVKFMEYRLTNLLPTIFVSDSRYGFLPKTTQDFMEAAECRILSDI